MSTPFYKAKLPTSRQAGIPEEIYTKLSTSPKCCRLGVECSTPCEPIDENGEYRVELDHIIPKSEGGKDTPDNLQWLCACENRKKYNRPDPRYSGHLFFDSEININKLRENQKTLAYLLAVREYKNIFEYPNRIYSRFMLLAWMVGGGKTVAMLAILFGINKIRKAIGNGSAKRAKKVLWLVHQSSLVDALTHELKTELRDHGICESNPIVEAVKDSTAWSFNADIIVSCPQALWDNNSNSMGDKRRGEILSAFDVIVVDEAHFAIENYLAIAQLAPLAFKFAITATPMDSDGNLFCDMFNGRYRNNFVLYSSFGYDAGRLAGIYKEVLPFKEGLGVTYIEEHGGDAVVRTGGVVTSDEDTDIANSLPRDLAIIRQGRRLAMTADVNTDYDNHVMVKVGCIAEAKSLIKSLSRDDDVIGVWSGSKGPNLGDKRHPWMLAKEHNGKIPRGGKRIVITIAMGQFGINNPYCSVIAWVAPNKSLIELVQRIGRAIRPTGNSSARVQLVWNGADKEFKGRIEEAITYIHTAETLMDAFPDMYGIEEDVPTFEPTPTESAVKPTDRVELANLMGNFQLEGYSAEDSRDRAVEIFTETKSPSEGYIDKINKYADLLTNEDDKAIILMKPTHTDPISFVESENGMNNYSTNRLTKALASGEISPALDKDLRGLKIKRIKEGDELSIAEATSELKKLDDAARAIDDAGFYPPWTIVTGKRLKSDTDTESLPVETYQKELTTKYHNAFNGGYKEASVAAQRAIIGALKEFFGLNSFSRKEYQPFEKQLSHAMMKESSRRIILKKAEYLLVKHNKDSMPGVYKIFENRFPEEGVDVD